MRTHRWPYGPCYIIRGQYDTDKIMLPFSGFRKLTETKKKEKFYEVLRRELESQFSSRHFIINDEKKKIFGAITKARLRVKLSLNTV